MSNLFKSGSSTLASKVTGSQSIGVNGSADYGPSNLTGFYNGVTIPSGSRLITYMSTSGIPYFHVAPNDTSTIFFLKSFGSTGSTITDVLGWAANQPQYSILTADLTNADLPNITPTPTPSITPTRASGTTPTPTPTLTPTNTPTVTPTNTVTPTPTPTISDTPTPTPTPTPSPQPTRYYYGTTMELAHGMTNGLSNVSFSSSGLCDSGIINAFEFNSLPSNSIYIYDSVSGALRQCTPGGYYGYASLTGTCNYQYGRYRVGTTQNGVCIDYTGFTEATFYDTYLNSSDFCNANTVYTSQLTGLTANTYYLYDTVTTNERRINVTYSGSTSFYLTGSCITNDCIQYVYSDTEIGVCTSTSALTNVNLNGFLFCSITDGGTIIANEFSGLTAGVYYVRDKFTNYVRTVYVNGFGSTYQTFTGGTCSTPCTTGRTGYYIDTTSAGAVSGGTQIFYVDFYGSTMCTGYTFSGTSISSLSMGTYYLYDGTANKVRQFDIYSPNSTTASLSGACTTPSNAARPGYYYSTTSADAVTGGTQAIGVVFGTGQSGDTMCNPSTISFYANGFSGLTPGSYYLYDGDANKVRAFTIYGGSNYGSMSGTCSTPSGGARSGYWYASSRPAAITGGTQVGDVTFSGGSNDLCTASSATSYTAFSSLNGYIYIYNGDTGDVRQFYGSNNSTISAMSSCLNTNTPVYYYSTSPNDCYNTQTLTNVTFSGGADFCSATGFSANQLSSLSPNTYYMRNPFTDNFRSFYCAYNGSVSFSNSCSQYSC